ncbi:MAG TPA: hypothetical protein VMF69_04580 [Gemmataceae bacterium]|nr:hypothetical protein [Gemmataceae bacterium]
MAWKPSLPRCFWIVCAGLVLTGCQEQEQVREYTVPKEPPVRLRAVMVPRANVTWFFKLMGPAPEVAKHVRTFDAFVASVRFPGPGKASIEWTVPDDWDEEHGDERFYAVLRFAGNGLPLPITVTPLGGPQAKDVRANLDRWRVKQLGLEEISDAELKKLDGNIQVDGIKATRVDFTGPGPSKGRRRFSPAPPAAPPRRSFTLTKPDGWEELPAEAVAGIRREAVFRVGSGQRSAKTTVLRLKGEGGGALANVNRWREELGLAPAKEDQLRQDLRSLDTASGRANYIELAGRDRDEERATLGAWIAHGGHTWFITMKGPADFVRSRKPAFEAFVKSFRFDNEAGAAHE